MVVVSPAVVVGSPSMPEEASAPEAALARVSTTRDNPMRERQPTAKTAARLRPSKILGAASTLRRMGAISRQPGGPRLPRKDIDGWSSCAVSVFYWPLPSFFFLHTYLRY